jgi:adenylate cyclase
MTATAMAADDLEAIARWLAEQALLATPVEPMFSELGDRLLALGLPILRGHASLGTLHPQIEAVSHSWWRNRREVVVDRHLHGSSAQQNWQQSPLKVLLESEADMLRRRIGPASIAEFPILGEFAAEGGTDYVAFATAFGFNGRVTARGEAGVLVSWLTDRPGGFSDAHIAALRAIQPFLAVAVRVASMMMIADAVLAAYLGGDAGRRVLGGEIRRGQVETIGAAILLADLRGFTALADRLPRDRLVAMLDAYLGCMADPVEENGGQVLKFMGDGLLATFPFAAAGPEAACRAATQAAREALARIDGLNASRAAAGEPTLGLDVALHLGEVAYGNVGSDRRLDFTVVGPAVNEASRMEGLCQALGVPVLASGAFVEALGAGAPFHSLGRHGLRGVREEKELFGLTDVP